MGKSNCRVPGCDRPTRAKGLCKKHYEYDRLGKPLVPLRSSRGRPPSHENPESAFWSRVTKTDSCWLWTGAKVRGYGNFKYRGGRCYAHRYSYEIATGVDLGGKVIDHLCHTPACVRPSHLRPATNTENLQNLKGANANSSSGIRGVRWEARRGTWCADVKANGKRHRRRFSNVADATEWAESMRATLHKVPPIS